MSLPHVFDDLLAAVVQIEDKEELGEWVGLCKIDKEGKPRKVVKCSCAVVKVSYGSFSPCLSYYFPLFLSSFILSPFLSPLLSPLSLSLSLSHYYTHKLSPFVFFPALLPPQEVSGDTEAWAVVQEYIKSKGGAI